MSHCYVTAVAFAVGWMASLAAAGEPYTVGVDPACRPEALQATSQACRIWESVCGIEFKVGRRTGDEIIAITYGDLRPGELGRTSFFPAGLTEVHPRLSGELLVRTIVHELGHQMMLYGGGRHSADPTSVMHAMPQTSFPNAEDRRWAVKFFGP